MNFAPLLARDTSTWTRIEGRKCGDCTLCCRILPVHDPNLNKDHGVRCKHQRHTGCVIYENRPNTCRQWSCGWLVGLGVDKMSRPDRSGYVVDPIADFAILTSPHMNDGKPFDQPMVVVWVDPKTPDKWRSDEALFEFFERWGEQGFGALVRYSSTLCVTVFPKSLTKLDTVTITPPKEAVLSETDPKVKFNRAKAALRK